MATCKETESVMMGAGKDDDEPPTKKTKTDDDNIGDDCTGVDLEDKAANNGVPSSEILPRKETDENESAGDEPARKKRKNEEKSSETGEQKTVDGVTPHDSGPIPVKVDETAENSVSTDEKLEVESTDKTKEKLEKPDSKTSGGKDRNSQPQQQYSGPLTETEAGITEYMSDHSGFSAIIKQRYSDFIVNEIDQDGQIIHLTDMSPPVDDDDAETSEQKTPGSDVISAEDWTKLEQLVASDDRKATVNIPAPADKEQRTKVHLAVKVTFPQLETKTIEEDDGKFIQAFWKKGKGRDGGRDDWPASKKACRYVRFVLYKENKDTMDAIGLMAKNLRVKENLFQYAGTKDKRAKTSQEVTALKIHPKKLLTLNKVLWNFGVGNCRYVKEPLKLGQLNGNHFTIVLRNVQGDPEVVEKALKCLESEGFVNYFGMQRFGTTSVPTHHVGRALLSADWDKAVDLILMPRNDHSSKDSFQTVWAESRDPEQTLNATPPYCGLERNLLQGLKNKLPPLNALEKISRNTRLLYVHSYQAYVWNSMVSRRLRELGRAPVKGDLVMPSAGADGGGEQGEKPSPVVLTEENLAQYSLRDVVLPLPGHSIVYPDNHVRDWYRLMLQEDGLDIDKMERPQKDYSLPGAYRHLVVYPTDVSWTHRLYDDYTTPLTLSDLDRVKKTELPASDTGKVKAVVLEMSLPSSTYATMALREVMRGDTSARHQTALNVT